MTTPNIKHTPAGNRCGLLPPPITSSHSVSYNKLSPSTLLHAVKSRVGRVSLFLVAGVLLAFSLSACAKDEEQQASDRSNSETFDVYPEYNDDPHNSFWTKQ